jgi:hypothetical protein
MKGVYSSSEEIGYNKVILSLEQNLGLEWKDLTIRAELGIGMERLDF